MPFQLTYDPEDSASDEPILTWEDADEEETSATLTEDVYTQLRGKPSVATVGDLVRGALGMNPNPRAPWSEKDLKDLREQAAALPAYVV